MCAARPEVNRGQTVSQKETVRLRQDGQRFIAALTLSPIVNATGAVSGITAVVRDVTEHKRTWEAWYQPKP